MLNLLWLVFTSAVAPLKSRRDLALENLALRQQLAVLSRAPNDSGFSSEGPLLTFQSAYADAISCPCGPSPDATQS